MVQGTETYSGVVSTAREYYNSDDADNFYFHIWGGEDIHIGLYEGADDTIVDASRRTVEVMASLIPGLDQQARVLDLGAGYGGAARYLARKFGCRVAALNLSEKENERNRAMNREQGLEDRIDVLDGSFEDVPFEDAVFDVVWSQDSFLHSGDRERVIAEAVRVLKPGGFLVFTDIMQVEGVEKETLQPVLDRIHLDSLGSLSFYRGAAESRGMSFVNFENRTEQLPRHYGRVLAVTADRENDLSAHVSEAYLQRMKTGLQHWIDAGENGRLKWGILLFRKPS